MVRLENLSKTYWLNGSPKTVANNINFTFPSGVSIALLGRNGAGKSTMMSMIAGTLTPDSGRVVSDGTISWPVGFKGSFHRDLTGMQNTRFIARIYGVDTDALSDFVEDFSELGAHYNMPLRTYSSGMRSRLSFAVSMGIHFDTYLVDEVTSVGDAAFKVKSRNVFLNRIGSSGAIVVSHSMNTIRRLCSAGVVLENGQLSYFDDINAAISQHEKNVGAVADD
ncbi:ABC transporter ATP-binding protein [Shimia sp. R10_1]|uniref:ABC transporter ATP-binding protein n=1 Tax=Shimia sp. R10_1 TaxID=2821095 RepID=UPI001ADB674A|nr:ABC transporter ATP-binding protein [Shimia sp. R10_1]MBO9473263.1 ABC transporter ATP-binding protein [Shimia sp. R10_1]